MVMRNWYDFAAVHSDNINSARIRFKGDIDHNDMYQHKIGDKVTLGISQGDINVSHFIDGIVMAVRFNLNVTYDVAVSISNSGVMAVLKNIPGDNLQNLSQKPVEKSIEENIESVLTKSLESLVEEEPEELVVPTGSKHDYYVTLFNKQVLCGKPFEHYVKIDGVIIGKHFEFIPCKYQIGDSVKIEHGGKTLVGIVCSIYVGQHIAYDIAVPAENGFYITLSDISPEYFEGVESV